MVAFGGFWFEDAPDYIFFSFQVWFHLGIFQEYFFLPLQKYKSEVSRAEIATAAYQVACFGGTALNKFVGRHFADGSDRNNKSFLGGRCVAANQVHAIFFAGGIHAFVKFIQRLEAKPVAEGNGKRNLGGRGIHRVDIADIHDHTFVSQVAQGCINEVEMNIFDEKVCTDHGFAFRNGRSRPHRRPRPEWTRRSSIQYFLSGDRSIRNSPSSAISVLASMMRAVFY